MKKWIAGLLLALLLVIPVAAAGEQLAQSGTVVIVKAGDTLGKIGRAVGLPYQTIAKDNGIKNPSLISVGQRLFIQDKEGVLGAATTSTPRRPTEFKTSLNEQKTERHTDTTLKVTSITTKDGFTISQNVLGPIIVLSVNPGASNAETVVCSGLTDTTKTFTGCSFGYRFDDPTASTTANIKAHSPGEPVIISNTDTYNSQNFISINGDAIINASNTWNGIQHFLYFPEMVSTTLHPTTTGQFATKRYVDTFAASGCSNADQTTRGCVEFGSATEIASSTPSGETGAFLIPSTLFTTTSPYSLTKGLIPATQQDGTLSPKFFNTSTQSYWFGASTTLSAASTTVTNLSLNSRNLSLNGKNYQLPVATTIPTTSSTLQNDGTGNLFWGPEDWYLCGATSTAISTTSLELFSLPAATNLRLEIYVPSRSSGQMSLKFNGDSGSNYSYRNYTDNSIFEAQNSTQPLNLDPIATTTVFYASVSVINYTASAKYLHWEGAVGNNPGRGAGQWNNTSAQINRVSLLEAGTTFNSGTTLQAFCSGR